MRSYRLYIINPFDGRIAALHEFEAVNHETAVWIADGLRHSRPMELWCGRAKIHGWESIVEAWPDDRKDEEMPMPGPALSMH